MEDDQYSGHLVQVADHIREYLNGHPYAADTVCGIHKWWVSGAVPSVSEGDVEEALGILVERGTIACRTLPDGTKVYTLAPVR